MRRRLLLLLVLTLTATACDYREVLRINADGSATLRVELELDRADHPDGIWPSQLDWDDAASINEQVTGADGDDTDAMRAFIVELFALEGTEPWIDDAVDGFEFDVDDSQLHLAMSWRIADLTAAPTDDRFPDSILLGDILVERSDGGAMSLSAPVRESATTLVSEYFALENDPFVDRAEAGDDGFPVRISAEIVVPGEVLHADAHASDGSRLSWSWELGRAGAPGVEVGWDSDGGGSSDWDVCGAFAPICYTVLILFGLLAIGILAATLGLFEAVRVTRRDRRDTS